MGVMAGVFMGTGVDVFGIIVGTSGVSLAAGEQAARKEIVTNKSKEETLLTACIRFSDPLFQIRASEMIFSDRFYCPFAEKSG